MKSFFSKILFLFRAFSFKLKLSAILLVIISTLGSFVELIALTSLLPVLNYVTSENIQNNYIDLPNSLGFLPVISVKQYILVVACIFLFKAALLFVSAYLNVKFSFTARFYLSKKLLYQYLFFDLKQITSRNSAELLRNITSEVNSLASGIFMPLLWVIGEITFLLFLISSIVFLEGTTVLICVFLISLIFYTLYLLLKNRLKKWGEKRQYYEKLTIQYINESIGSLIDIKLNSLETYFLEKFSGAASSSIKYLSIHMFFGLTPRIIIETFVVLLFLVGIFFIVSDIIFLNSALIGFLFVTSFRVLPSANRLIVNLQQLHFYSASLNLVYEELKHLSPAIIKKRKNNHLQKISDLEIKKGFFKYRNSKNYLLKNLNFKISNGNSVGIYGPSGSGKSTFVNLLLGLYELERGCLLVNKNDLVGFEKLYWRRVSYVPQNTFLLDDTLKNNVTISGGNKPINRKKFQDAIRISKLTPVISRLENNIDTVIGENGSLLSGGQRQRIGIARALYKDFDVLIFDEATSALDNKLALDIVEEILAVYKSKIIIFVSHKPELIKKCKIKVLIDS